MAHKVVVVTPTNQAPEETAGERHAASHTLDGLREHYRSHIWDPVSVKAPAPLSLEELEQLPPLEAFLRTLNLIDTGACTNEDIFTGPSQWMPHGRVFGGQVAAQSIVAAARTVPEDRVIHSMHGYFIRPGDIHSPITLSVARLHDGGSFTTRRVQAYQYGKTIWSMICSFQLEQNGFAHCEAMPEGLPAPEDLPAEAGEIEAAGEQLANYWMHRRPFITRHVDQPIYTTPAAEATAQQALWVKAVDTMPDDPVLHQAAIAYFADYTILEPVLRRHGITWTDPRLRLASLDHGVHWHRPARVDDWLLYVQNSTAAQGGRGLTLGRIYTRDGELVASITQEGMVRLKDVSVE
ncbi:acyl-CoA thioesterase II [Pseudoclavibacter alba]|nr:acyl-CoA thioesterase II [Pseudoclavibacter alba]